MTFKAKSGLQRQWCNAWTEFRGCVLQGDLSHAVSQQEKRSPHVSCYANRVSHLLFFLQILIEQLRQDCTDFLMPSSDCHICPTTGGINGRTCLLHPACMRGAPSSVRLRKLSLCLLSSPLSSPQGVLFLSNLGVSKCVQSGQFYSNKAACIIYMYLFCEKRTYVPY